MFRQSVKKYCRETKKTFAILKAKTNNPPVPTKSVLQKQGRRKNQKLQNFLATNNIV